MNFFERLKLKIISENWEMYGQLKQARIRSENAIKYEPIKLPNIDCNLSNINFKHSGNSGDIIYSIPAMKSIIGESRRINLFLSLDQIAGYTVHPLGNVMLNQKMADMLIPLLEHQNIFHKCDIYENQKIHIDLDIVRKAPIHFDKIILPRWYFLVFGCYYDLSNPWLEAPVDESTKDAIVIARSYRYRGSNINYNFLKKYSNIHFIGLKDEYKDMKAAIPHLIHRPVANFLEMASLIASAKLFIGNQSFPYSIAEGLKANRLLEVCHSAPDVAVCGTNGNEFYFQEHFEKLVKLRYENGQSEVRNILTT